MKKERYEQLKKRNADEMGMTLDEYDEFTRQAVEEDKRVRQAIRFIERATIHKVAQERTGMKNQAEMVWQYGSTQGRQCWCGEEAASGLTHQKVFRPYNCGSYKCRETQEDFDRLPKGPEEDWENIFSQSE